MGAQFFTDESLLEQLRVCVCVWGGVVVVVVVRCVAHMCVVQHARTIPSPLNVFS